MNKFLGISYFVRIAPHILKHYFIKEKESKELYAYNKCSLYSEYFMKLSGLNIKTFGTENIPEGPALYVCNHQDILDIPLVLKTIKKPLGFAAKKELRHVPVIGYWVNALGGIFIDRKNTRKSIKALNDMIEKLKNGKSMVIYPEGTRSRSKELSEFKKGSIKLGVKANVPIVPVAINGTYKALKNCKNKNAYIIIDKPIYPSELSREDIKKLDKDVELIIRSNLEKFED